MCVSGGEGEGGGESKRDMPSMGRHAWIGKQFFIILLFLIYFLLLKINILNVTIMSLKPSKIDKKNPPYF